jgi:hypothetical protein
MKASRLPGREWEVEGEMPLRIALGWLAGWIRQWMRRCGDEGREKANQQPERKRNRKCR